MKLFDKPYVIDMLDPECVNMSSRDGRKIDMITLHFTVGLSAKGSLEWGKLEEAGGAAHFYVDRDGRTYQSVPLDMRAWHHGASAVEYQGKIEKAKTDRSAIGVEMSNCGPIVRKPEGFFFNLSGPLRKYPSKYAEPKDAVLSFNNGINKAWFWEPYPKELVDSVTRLTVDLVQTFDVPIQRIVGHEDVATPLGDRKFDPGPLWDWKTFIPEVCSRLGVPVPNDVWKLHKTVG